MCKDAEMSAFECNFYVFKKDIGEETHYVFCTSHYASAIISYCSALYTSFFGFRVGFCTHESSSAVRTELPLPTRKRY